MNQRNYFFLFSVQAYFQNSSNKERTEQWGFFLHYNFFFAQSDFISEIQLNLIVMMLLFITADNIFNKRLSNL